MPKTDEQTFRLSPGWKIKQSGKTLVISGGADAKFEVELEVEGRSFFSALKSSSTFTRGQLNSHDQSVLEELITAEIIVPDIKKQQNLNVALLGDTKNFVLPESRSITTVEPDQTYDLALIVRINSSYSDLLENIDYHGMDKPHLLVELAFHHTASIGPLVFPGETACVACLQGRINTRWGDETPPRSPKAATDYKELVSELVATELDRIARSDTSLTNKTVNWNFQDRTITTAQLLKVPLCPLCAQNKVDHSGALALPWSEL